MTKYLKLPLRLGLVRHPGQTVLSIEFDTGALVEWCLALCLLRQRLIAALLLCEAAGKGRLEIQVVTEPTDHVRTVASFESHTSRLMMTMKDLDYLLHFFLKYYRDGIAEVDHLDIEVVAAGERQDTSITFKVPEAIQPLNAEEAKRRLGL